MDYEWMGRKLQQFVNIANSVVDDENLNYESQPWRTAEKILLKYDPVVRKIIIACQLDLESYGDDAPPWIVWRGLRDDALRAKGVCENFDEMKHALAPDNPVADAGNLHEWVWGAAQQLWLASSYQEAVNAASRAVNARIQQKSSRRDISEYDLVMQVFDIKPPSEGKPRLWMPGDVSDPTWRSLQEGVKFYGVGCFKAIRNPAAHKESTNWTDQEAMEYLSSFSVFARWVSVSELQVHS